MVDFTSVDDPKRLEHLVSHIQDAVVEFRFHDGEPIVQAVNPAFTDIFGYEPEEIEGEPLNEYIVPPWLAEEARDLDERTDSGDVNYRRVSRQTADGLGEFLYRGIPYDNGFNGGFAIYTDLTDGLRRERRLEVLNRILRHNLRNKVTVIEGGVEHLLSEVERGQELTDHAKKVRDASTDLLGLADEATEIQRTLNESLPDSASLDCVELIQTEVDQLRADYPNAAIETDIPGELSIAASDRLRFAIAALVENAIEHNPDDNPTVLIRAKPVLNDEWVDITVDDTGPQIPAKDKDVITGDRDITPTAHGNGLGLWLVKWTVDQYGGELTFEVTEDGNRVRIRLPRPSELVD